ncbi:tail fiber assembly protein [Orbaceae bacterium ESL0727]|nr:tail fiber assembly protein [Orbaceae bacterium ESL0727]
MNKYIFGKIDDSFFEIILTDDENVTAKEGFVLMKEERPGIDYIADKRGEWIIDTKRHIKDNEATVSQLLSEANNQIGILQDIIDLDMQEADEEQQLKAWKKYRILLLRVDVSSVNIDWPTKPI